MGTPGAAEVSGKVRVLLVEDDDASRTIGSQLLVMLGNEVEVAENGAEALRLATSRAFDVVLMDCQMPVMDGLEATRRIRAAERETPLPGRAGRSRLPIVALTARTLPEQRELCLSAGMDEHVAKPIDAERLMAVLGRFGTAQLRERLASGAARGQAGAARGQAGPVPEEPEIDEATLRARCLGKSDLAARVLEKAAATLPEAVASMREAADRALHGPLARAAHSLKGLAGNIAAMGLHASAMELEAFLRAHPAADVPELRSRVGPVAAAVQRCLADVPRARAALGERTITAAA